MRRWGLRALKWPLKRTAVDEAISNIERYKSLFNLALQVDQMRTINLLDQKIDLGRLQIAKGAAFDSYENQHDECLPGTRIELLRQVEEWTESPHGKCIFWLNGMAGTGKSTISRTVAARLKGKMLLGASFFFKRGEENRSNTKRLFPTLIEQLVASIPQLIPSIQKAIEEDPHISDKSLREQFDKLLLHPLISVNLDQPTTMVVVIDALDECEREEDIRIILQLLPQVQILKSMQLRFFLTSRPELPIRLGFKDITGNYQDLDLYEIPKPEIEHDISLFLEHRLSEIRKDRSLPLDWPGGTNIQTLITMSVPLFIFAATVCRIFDDHDLDPVISLTEILQYQNEASKLDGTYLPVINRSLVKYSEKKIEQLVEEFREVVGAIIILESPLSVISLSKLTGVPKTSINARLNSLHSVLSVPNDETRPVRLFYLSFRDFLLDTDTRAKTPFWVGEKERHHRLTIQCLEVMQHSLKKNICKLPSDGTLRSEMDTDSISLHLPSELQYSCRYWAQHLIQSRDPISVLDVAFVFLEKHFLHWVEAMSILGVVSEVVGIINRLQKVIQDDKNSKISEFLHDARRFILKNMQIADTAPLQLYCSALVFAPEMSTIRRIFKRQIPYWICRLPSVHKSWNAELQTLEGHKGPVVSVAFSSPDGRLVASGCFLDYTVKLWDATTGALQQTLEGHPGPVWAVTFSPDGRLLASAGDQAVKLWDTATGALQHDLKCCSYYVWCVAFSPDGRLLASADGLAAKLWNTETGTLQQTLEGHSSWIHSVVFSSDGKLVASGGYHDQTVKLWDASTGALQQTLESGPAAAISVAFSPDGKLLAAAGYEDQTIKLWDIASGTLKQSLKGHLARVRSVDFSPNAKLVLSGSEDQTVRLWYATTGVLLQTLEGHSGWILSVAFSPRDGMVASGGYHDHTIKLWDVSTRVPDQTPGGHLGDIHSVALSPGGKLVASGSTDHTVKLWDAATGVLQHTLEGFRGSKISSRGSYVVFSPNGKLVAAWVQATILISGKKLDESNPHRTINVWDTATGVIQQSLDGHSGPVWSVLFSSDSKLVVSGSHDRTIKIWDAATGALQQTLVGHSGAVMSIALSSDDTLVASGSEDTTVKLWDIATGTLQQTLEGHPSDDTDDILYRRWVRAVAISPDGRLVVSRTWTSGDIMVWNAVMGALEPTELVDERTMDPTRPQATVKISVEGQWVALQGEKVLWLPPEYRALCSAVEDGTLVLGHKFGRVSFMEFNLQ